jgi:hypothetical protein
MNKIKKPKVEPITPEQQEALDQKVTTLHDLRLEAKGLSQEIADLQADVLDMFKRHGLTEVVVKEGRKTVAKGVLVQAVTEVLNEPRLAKRLGSKVWAKVTTKRLDKDKLAQAIKDGIVQPNDVAACSDPKPSSPYIKSS